jgi:hypothetical protein
MSMGSVDHRGVVKTNISTGSVGGGKSSRWTTRCGRLLVSCTIRLQRPGLHPIQDGAQEVSIDLLFDL